MMVRQDEPPMTRTLGLICVVLTSLTAAGEDVVIRDVQVPSAKEELTNASLTFSDSENKVQVRITDGRFEALPYSQIDTISYEYTKKHRLKQGVGIGMLSPATGIIIAFTKSKNHWMEIDFHDKDATRAFVLKLDKHDYQKVCDAAKAHTGKEVAQLGKTDAKAIKAKIKD